MVSRVPVFDDEYIAGDATEDTEDEKVLAVGVAGHIANVRGGAELLESFYCHKDDDHNKDFGFGDSFQELPGLPVELEFYKDKTFQVF